MIFIIGSICGIYLEKFLRSAIESKFTKTPVNSTWDQLSNLNFEVHNMALYSSKKANLYKKNSLAQKNFDSIKVLCWVLTTQRTLYTKAKAVKETWGQRCHTLLFFSSEPDNKFPVISLNVKEGIFHFLFYCLIRLSILKVWIWEPFQKIFEIYLDYSLFVLI